MILARNEARNLPLTLRSLPAQMPVLVIDHQSYDDTARIAAQAGARVITRPFEGFVNARLFAVSQVQTPWSFMIDADERPDERLAQAFCTAGEGPDGYLIARTTLYRGKPLRMWKGERILRLFKTGVATLEAFPAAGGSAQLHERWRVNGETPLLDGLLLHDSYPTANAYASKFAEYTQTEALGIHYSAVQLAREVVKTPLRFAWYSLAKGALLDGADGIRVAWSSARYPAIVQWKSRSSR